MPMARMLTVFAASNRGSFLTNDRRAVGDPDPAIPAQAGSPSLIWFVLVTKPKQNLTFQIVASRQKSGEVVPQQSSTSTQL
jgi:hypothetical protein